MIQTVRGKIPASELGITMAHEHLSVNLAGVRHDEDSIFGYSPLVLEELRRLRDAGAKSVIEVSCNDMGRNVLDLKRYSEELGINIVCSTGFYLEVFHPAWLKDAPVEKIEQVFADEFENGIGDTGIKPGVIGEIAGEKTQITPSERKVMKAAAHVASKVGCAVTTHCQLGQMAPEQAKLLTDNGMKPEKIILGHLDLANDMDYYQRVLSLGVNIGFDTCGKVRYLADEVRADNLAKLVSLGYEKQIVLSTDISRKSYMHANGGYGYTDALERIVPMLLERGVSQKSINAMLIDNPARIFDIEEND
jgi:phosphotriesterase-related protein